MGDFHIIEQAAFDAWPSDHQVEINGWLLRLDRGYTKRANSLNATAYSRPMTSTDFRAIETQFRTRGLPPVVRLTSISPEAHADHMLAVLGYDVRDPSIVMTRSLSGQYHADPATSLTPDVDDWLHEFAGVTGQTSADARRHGVILRRIKHPRMGARLHASGAPASCGLGVTVGQYLGIFDVATRADCRQRGFARRVCETVMSWGAQAGATTAFLQVAADNQAAIRLYRSLGFEIAYHYWYRIAQPERAA